MSEVETVPAINKDSRVADVAAYVRAKLLAYEFVEDLQKFVIDQRINGNAFLNLTDAELKEAGLSALGDRKELLTLVDELSGARISNPSSNIRCTTNHFAIDAQFKPVQGYSLLSTLNMLSLKKCFTPPTVKSDDEKLLAVWCSDFLINQEMSDDFCQYFFLREEAKREIDFLDDSLQTISSRRSSWRNSRKW
jgi:hypothetical protein